MLAKKGLFDPGRFAHSYQTKDSQTAAHQQQGRGLRCRRLCAEIRRNDSARVQTAMDGVSGAVVYRLSVDDGVRQIFQRV